MRRSIRAIAAALTVALILPAVVVSAWPVADRHSYLSQGYKTGHRADDIAAPAGTEVVPIKAGRVVFAGWKRNCGGYQVWLAHGNGLYSAYYHLRSESVNKARTSSARRRELAGSASGCAQGTHVHLEVWRGFPWGVGPIASTLEAHQLRHLAPVPVPLREAQPSLTRSVPADRIAESLAFINWTVLTALGAGRSGGRRGPPPDRGHEGLPRLHGVQRGGVRGPRRARRHGPAPLSPELAVRADHAWDSPRRLALTALPIIAAIYGVALRAVAGCPACGRGSAAAALAPWPARCRAAAAWAAPCWSSSSESSRRSSEASGPRWSSGTGTRDATAARRRPGALRTLAHPDARPPDGPVRGLGRAGRRTRGHARVCGARGAMALFVWLRLLVGLIFPLIVSWAAIQTARSRSMESATGLLYINVGTIAAGTILAAGLYFGAGSSSEPRDAPIGGSMSKSDRSWIPDATDLEWIEATARLPHPVLLEMEAVPSPRASRS